MKKVLLVDNEPYMCELFQIAFEDLSAGEYRIETVTSGKDCLEKLGKGGEFFDLIVMDVSLNSRPEGIETVQLIRKNNPDQKIFMLTGYTLNPEMKIITDLGIGVTYKPFDVEELDLVIRNYVGL